MCGVAVMYEAKSGDILTTGGAPTYKNSNAKTDAFSLRISEADGTVHVQQVASMKFARSFHSGVVVPDGSVFITGGQEFAAPFSDDCPVLTPEIYNASRGTWKSLRPKAIPRTYHSFAILLPDARILAGGGGLSGDCNGCNHFDAQIFTPPYLLRRVGTLGQRPNITGLSRSSVKPGDSLTVTADTGIRGASLIRYGSTTHGVNTDQRRIGLSIQAHERNSNQITVTIPSEPGVAIPGYWMLFILDRFSVPSVAAYLKVEAVKTTAA
jgi:galactose oxidase